MLPDTSVRSRLGRSLAIAFALLMCTFATAEENKHVPGLDWERMLIRAIGSGAPDVQASNIAVARLGAERAARSDAVRSILEILEGVRIDAESTAGGMMSRDPDLKARVEGLLERFELVDTRYYADGGVEVDVKVSLTGDLLRLLLPEGDDDVEPPADGEAEHTGLIINASGLDVELALAPRVLDERGREVYAPGMLDREAITDRGAVSYERSLRSARSEAEIVGESPMVVRAIESKGTDVVISNADAAGLKRQNLSFLTEGRVMLVVDDLGNEE